MRKPFESQTTETPPMLRLRELRMEADAERTIRVNPTLIRRFRVGVSAAFDLHPSEFAITQTPE